MPGTPRSADLRVLLAVALPFATLAVAVLIWLLVVGSPGSAPAPDCGPEGCEAAAEEHEGPTPLPRGASRGAPERGPSRASPSDAGGGEDARPSEPDELSCRSPRDCVLATNYNVCCPCTIAMLREIVARNDCMFPASGAPPRPEQCGVGCHPELCSGCPADPVALDCRNGQCVTLYTGECTPGESGCGDGRSCEIVEGEALCVDDPSECQTTADCRQRGYECRDWDGTGVMACWHPASTCRRSLTCSYHRFCEDADGDGIFECVDGGADCHPLLVDLECGAGQICSDPDGDGRGSCADP